MQRKIKTIDVNAKEWFDRVNGNSYFSAQVTINFGLPSEETLYLPFQYGYGSQYEYAAAVAVKRRFPKLTWRSNTLHGLRDDNNIVLRRHMTENCRQRDVKAWGTQPA